MALYKPLTTSQVHLLWLQIDLQLKRSCDSPQFHTCLWCEMGQASLVTNKELARVVRSFTWVVNCQIPPSLLPCSTLSSKFFWLQKLHSHFQNGKLEWKSTNQFVLWQGLRLWHSTQRTRANNKLLLGAHRLKGTDGECLTVMILHFPTSCRCNGFQTPVVLLPW